MRATSRSTPGKTRRASAAGAEKAGGAARARILAAAEQLFGERGYDGTSARQIALAAEVPVALVNYHFGSKEGLYRAIFELRTPTIVDQRLAGLQLAELESDPDKRLELVIKTLIVPMVHLRNAERSAGFARILAREVSDPSSKDRTIISDLFDPIALRVLKAIGEALPDRTPEEIHWAYHVMLGAMMFTVADAGRIKRLSEGLCDPDDEASTAAHLVALLHAALKYGKLPQRGTAATGGTGAETPTSSRAKEET
jgi:AcrR family transcriptional regulator